MKYQWKGKRFDPQFVEGLTRMILNFNNAEILCENIFDIAYRTGEVKTEDAESWILKVEALISHKLDELNESVSNDGKIVSDFVKGITCMNKIAGLFKVAIPKATASGQGKEKMLELIQSYIGEMNAEQQGFCLLYLTCN